MRLYIYNDGRVNQVGQVCDIEKEIISEQSKKEICDACKAMMKDCGATEEQLEKFDHIFYTVADKYIFGAKKRIGNLKEHLHLTSAHCIIYLERLIGIDFRLPSVKND
jgi:hypothetical protein